MKIEVYLQMVHKEEEEEETEELMIKKKSVLQLYLFLYQQIPPVRSIETPSSTQKDARQVSS